MSVRRLTLGGAVWLMVACVTLALGGASALAVTTRLPLPFSPFGSAEGFTGMAVDQSSGNVFVVDSSFRRLLVFGAEGGSPAGGIPGELTGVQTPAEKFKFGGEPAEPVVDSACVQEKLTGSACTAFDPSNGDIYVPDVKQAVIDKFAVNGSNEYEYVCQFTGFGFVGSACLKNKPTVQGTPSEVTFSEPLGVAVDSEGNVYVADYGSKAVYEFNSAGEDVRKITSSVDPAQNIAVDATGDIYIRGYGGYTGNGYGGSSEIELKRSSLTGLVESEANPHSGTTALAFDLATGRLFLGHGSTVEEYSETGEALGSFGLGVIGEGRGIAVNEANNYAYVVNGGLHQIDAFGPPVDLASVTTGPPSNIVKVTATVSGSVNPEGAGEAHYYFQYGTSTEYGSVTPEEATNVETPASANLAGLAPETTYHYRLVATTANGTNYGEDKTFITSPAVTVKECLLAHPSQATSATLCASIDPEGVETTFYFQYGTSTEYGARTPEESEEATRTGTEAHEFTLPITGLQPAVTYHYRVVSKNELGMTYGPDQALTTPAAPPTVNDQKPYATEVALHEATLNGTINPGSGITEYHFVYGLAAGEYTHSAAVSYAPLNYEDDSVTQLIIGLEPGRVYHYALVATNSTGTSTGTDSTFSTLSMPAPTVQAGEASEPASTLAGSPLSTLAAPLLVPAPPFPALEAGTSAHKGTTKKLRRKRVKRKKTARRNTGVHHKGRASQ